MADDNTIDGITIVPEPTGDLLNGRERVDYAMHREQLLKWLLHLGKDPDHAEGYARETVRGRSNRIDAFYRWVWAHETDGYTTNVTTDHADAYLQQLAYSDHSNAHKANVQKALLSLFKWRSHTLGEEDWEPELRFSSGDPEIQPPDYFTRDERTLLREAALNYKSIPHYNGLSPEERTKWKAYLAQRFEKPKQDVGPEDWKRANSWKYPSLVWTSLDAGLRPIEVKRSTVSWIDVENEVLRIPKDESSKNRDNWIVGLQSRTARALERWLQEREQYETYADTDAVWLTRDGNPYNADSLRYLARRLAEDAGIPPENRKITWYAIRHSTGTYMTDERDLSAAAAQLRHRSKKTTMRYDHAPVEDRKEALERMG